MSVKLSFFMAKL